MITTAVMTKRKRSEHYVNNKEFLAALIKYREDKEIAEIQAVWRVSYKSQFEVSIRFSRVIFSCKTVPG